MEVGYKFRYKKGKIKACDSKTTFTYSYRKIKTKQYKQAKAQQEIIYYLY